MINSNEKGIFDVSDLEKEISKIREGCGEKLDDDEFDLNCGEDFENINSDSGASFILCYKCRKEHTRLETTLEERQRIKALVEQYYVPRKDFDKGQKAEKRKLIQLNAKNQSHIKRQSNELARLNKIIIKGRYYNTNYWELFNPDGTSSISNFNPIEAERQKFLRLIDDKIKIRKLSEGFPPTYKEIFSINDLEELRQKVEGK